MVKLTIDKKPVEVEEGTTILEAARATGVYIPTLCYLKGINEIGACRVCIAEVEGRSRLVTTCNTPVEEGISVLTNSPRVRLARRTNIQFILSQHDCNCPSCVRSGNCELQTIANNLGISSLPYKKDIPESKWDKNFPLIKDDTKCIKCMRCIQVCKKIQSLGIWDVENTGKRTTVGVSFDRDIKDADCALCGQCITHCPTGALSERDDTLKAFRALADPDVVTVVQIAPAVRAAWGETIGVPREAATINRLVAALRKMGFDYIFDTNFTADLTIMEEGSEFVKKFTDKAHGDLPLFTSCCPGWVRFMKSQYPDMMDHFSTTKSPQQMFGAVAKTYFAKLKNIDPSKICCISIMPCTAKKFECTIPGMDSTGTGQDVNFVLTTREVDRMISSEHIRPMDLMEENFDTPLGTSTGAGVIFGATGGVMEAALRSVYYLITGGNPDADAFSSVRGREGWREFTFDVAGTPVNVAIASGLGNARKLIEAIRRGEVKYDFVEVMACPGGCSGGGGQPIAPGEERAYERGQNLYNLDKTAKLRFSHENPAVADLYAFDHMREEAHHLLHTNHNNWTMPQAPAERD